MNPLFISSATWRSLNSQATRRDVCCDIRVVRAVGSIVGSSSSSSSSP
jgi:hypothetical protein